MDCPTKVWLRVHWSPYGISGGQTRPPEDHDNDSYISNDKLIVTEPTASTSSIPFQELSDVGSGLELLEKTLLGCHSSGLVALPFIDLVKNDSSKL